MRDRDTLGPSGRSGRVDDISEIIEPAAWQIPAYRTTNVVIVEGVLDALAIAAAAARRGR